jgi:hypothetical protein
MENFVCEIFTLLLVGFRALSGLCVSLLFSCIYPYIFASDFDRVARHGDRWVGEKFATGHVVLPAVPGTYDRRAFEFTLAERAASMEAYIVDSVELTFNIR